MSTEDLSRVMKLLEESSKMKTFDKTVIDMINEGVFKHCPTLRDQLEKCETNEEANTVLQSAKNRLAKTLSDLDSGNRELVDELHRYNKYKDMAQSVIGTLAQLQGVTVKEIHERWNLPVND